jgi:c-di-GMP-binding flagellar brake protein YcgR
MIERRQYQRVPFHCRTTFAARGAGDPVEGWTIDLSLVGVQMASTRNFPLQQLISITFHFKDLTLKAIAERADGVIVRKHAESEGYLYGVEFLDSLDSSRQPLLLRKLENS